MANSDYIPRTGGYGFCPMAVLAEPLDPLETVLTISGYSSSISGGIRIGMAAMIDDEIVSVTAQTGNDLTLGRGCCDTVPAAHDTGAIIWFFDDSIGRDGIEYVGTETIGVKMMPRTVSGGAVPIEYADPQQLTFGLRFARPYPPGLVTANGSPWFTPATLNETITNLVLAWVHRNRITQQDTLVDHMAASVTPEAGTTYTLRIYKGSSLVRTVTGLTSPTYTYTLATAISDFSATFGSYSGHCDLVTVRDGLESFQKYTIPFTLEMPTSPYGLGYRLGQHLGTNTP
jgi:hypothetical protein